MRIEVLDLRQDVMLAEAERRGRVGGNEKVQVAPVTFDVENGCSMADSSVPLLSSFFVHVSWNGWIVGVESLVKLSRPAPRDPCFPFRQ